MMTRKPTTRKAPGMTLREAERINKAAYDRTPHHGAKLQKARERVVRAAVRWRDEWERRGLKWMDQPTDLILKMLTSLAALRKSEKAE